MEIQYPPFHSPQPHPTRTCWTLPPRSFSQKCGSGNYVLWPEVWRQIVANKKNKKSQRPSLKHFIYVCYLTHSVRHCGKEAWVQMLTVCLRWCSCGQRQKRRGKKIEKVWRIIKGKVNKRLKVIRKQTLTLYKSDFYYLVNTVLYQVCKTVQVWDSVI